MRVLLLCLTIGLVFPAAARAQDLPSPPEHASEPRGFIAEPDLVLRVALWADRHVGKGDLTNGWYVEQKMIPGAGWLTVGPGFRHWYKRDNVLVDGSAAISWRGYTMAQGRIELPKLLKSRLAAGAHLRWQDYPHVDYFGQGPDSVEANRSEYGIRGTNVAGYATLRPLRWIDLTGTVGSLTVRNVDDRAFTHTAASLTIDTRDFPSHPTRGVLLRAGASRYVDRDGGLFTFNRVESEAAGFIPIAGARAVIALHGWVIGSDSADGRLVPIYLQPSLGGAHTLRSYADYRFHDRSMAVANAELRLALMTHMDLAVFADAGNVAPTISQLDLARRSYGAGLRMHTRRHTVARLDAATGDEGWRVTFRLTEPLELSRLSRRIANAPFVP
jgi:hypothetical protein